MATKINAAIQIQAGTVTRSLINTSTSGSAVITKIIAGSGISLSSTGIDNGTGDVTISNSLSPIRTLINDTGYSVKTTDQLIAYTSLTATRTVTLPPASNFPSAILLIIDESGNCNGNQQISIVPSSTSDFINGISSIAINIPYGFVQLESNGSHNWTVVSTNFYQKYSPVRLELFPSAGTTSIRVNGGYNIGMLDVYVNGIKLTSNDFSATDGSNVILSNATSSGDDVQIISLASYSVGYGSLPLTGGSIVGNLLVQGDFSSPGIMQTVSNNAALIAYSGLALRVYRAGFTTPGDGGAATYNFVSSTSLTVDNGACVQSTALSGYWIMDPTAQPPDVRQWGAVPSGGDATTAIQAALTAAITGKLYIIGVFGISSLLNNPKGTVLTGTNKNSCAIYQNSTTSGVISFSAAGGGIKSLTLNVGGSPTSGSAIFVSGSNGFFDDFIINNCYNGIECTGVANQFTNFQVINYVNTGIYGHDTNDNIFLNFIVNAGNATNGALGGIRLINKAEAFYFTNGEVLNGVYSLTTDSANYTQGNRPAYCRFSEVYFDSSAKGSTINNMILTEFNGCWVSGGRTGSGYPGLEIVFGDSLTFTSTEFFNSGASGVQLDSNCKRIMFNSCTASDNSVTAALGAYPGILVKANTTDFGINNCKGSNGLYSGGQQSYFVVVESGSSDRYTITNNLCTGNVTGKINDNGTGTNKTVLGNY